jgi:hypothetical protein
MTAENFYKLIEDELNHLYPNHLYSGLYELNERDFPILDSEPRKISRLKRGIMSFVGGLFIAGLIAGCSAPTTPPKSQPPTDNYTIPKSVVQDNLTLVTDNLTIEGVSVEIAKMIKYCQCSNTGIYKVNLVNRPAADGHNNWFLYTEDELKRVVSDNISEEYQIPGEALDLTSPGRDKLFAVYGDGISENLTKGLSEFRSRPLTGKEIMPRNVLLIDKTDKRPVPDIVDNYIIQTDNLSINIDPRVPIIGDLGCDSETVHFGASRGDCCVNTGYIKIYEILPNGKEKFLDGGDVPFSFTFDINNVHRSEKYTNYRIILLNYNDRNNPKDPNPDSELFMSRKTNCEMNVGGGGGGDGGGGPGGGCGAGPGGPGGL